jgi:hypothetical protein
MTNKTVFTIKGCNFMYLDCIMDAIQFIFSPNIIGYQIKESYFCESCTARGRDEKCVNNFEREA